MSPCYVYQCDNCDNEEMRNYSITGAPKIVDCKKCGEHKLTRCIGRGCMIKMDGVKFFKDGGGSSNCAV